MADVVMTIMNHEGVSDQLAIAEVNKYIAMFKNGEKGGYDYFTKNIKVRLHAYHDDTWRLDLVLPHT